MLIASNLFFVSCDFFTEEVNKNPIARVNKTYLYEEDVQNLISENTSPEDSVLIVSNYITRWATQQLLIDQAKLNLAQEKLNEYDKLVKEYQSDLLTEAYKNVIVGKKLDSTISGTEYQEYYEANKDNFRLNEVLVQMRYVQVAPDYSGLAMVKEKFSRFNLKDRSQLNSQDFKFISHNFNDSLWVQKETLLKVLPVLKSKSDEVLKKSNFTQLEDSLGVYLVKIQNVLKPNDIAPLSFIKPTLQQIILNQRKLELIKELEKDITKDAIKSENFEIYKNN